MKCVHCGVTIAGRSDVCPLCHAVLATTAEEKTAIRALPKAFPKRGKVSILETNLFDKIYFLIAVILSMVSVITELVVLQKLQYSYLVVISHIYLYFCVRSTLHNNNHFNQKLTAQTVFISVILVTVQGTFEIASPVLIYEYALPVLYIISMLASAVNLMVNIKKPRIHLITMLTTAFLAIVPAIIVNAIVGQPIQKNLLPLVIAIVGGVVIVLSVVLWAKKIFAEVQRIFHI